VPKLSALLCAGFQVPRDFPVAEELADEGVTQAQAERAGLAVAPVGVLARLVLVARG